MPEDKRPLKVFLCHAHSDKYKVRELYLHLTKDGVDAWLDKEKLVAGQDWEHEIRKAVRESDVVVVCHSKQFNQKGFRQKEVRIALEEADLLPKGEIFIVPARLEECDVLEDLQRYHWVDLFDGDGYERLMRALRTRADKIGATLQMKRSWLPKITTPRSKPKKPVEDKKLEEPKKKAIEEKHEIYDNLPPLSDEMPLPTDNFPDGWDAEWQPSFETETTKTDENRDAAKKEDEEKKKFELKRALKKIDKDHKHQLRKIEWQYRWETFIDGIRYRLRLLCINFKLVLIVLIGLAIIVPLLIDLSNRIPELAQAINVTQTTTSTLTSQLIPLSKTIEPSQVPTELIAPTLTPTKVFTPTITPLPTEITDAKGVSMVLVPAGEFTMGSDTYYDEKPIHRVYVGDVYMDAYEVTNALYKSCVETGGCTTPNSSSYYNNSAYSEHPVVYVNWNQAKTYCEWRGARLPTEAEWEKAARGTDMRTYPWGEGIDCSYANYNLCVGWDSNAVATTGVGSYEKGASPYQIYDMAGNVWEWVADWFDKDYYINFPIENPPGPASGQYRVVRGGSYYDNGDYARSANRDVKKPEDYSAQVGFRCAKDAP